MSLPNLPADLRSELLDLRYRKHRQTSGLVVIEGMSQIRELVECGWTLRYAVTSKLIRPSELPSGLAVYLTEQALIGRISELQHPPELLVCAEYKTSTFEALDPSKPIIFTDRIADPGNLGTMFRTGEWFGIRQWLIGPGTVDPFNSKVLRAAMGSLPRLTVVASADPVKDLKKLQKQGMNLVATMPSAKTMQIPSKNSCIMFGSEAGGLSQEYVQLADSTFTIVRKGEAESLNVAIAFAITVYEIGS